MQIPILIEPVAGNGYRSRGGEQFDLCAEGATREEVLAKLREQLQARVRAGSQVVSLELQPEPHPLARFAGMFKDDPLFENWDQDATAVEDAYGTQDPATVARELAEAAEVIAAHFESLPAEAWSRPGRRSDGAAFTVDTFARYFVHDPIHHTWDAESGYRALDQAGA